MPQGKSFDKLKKMIYPYSPELNYQRFMKFDKDCG